MGQATLGRRMESTNAQGMGFHSTTGRGVWYRRDPRSSPLGISALVVSIAASSGFIAGVARPIANGTLASVLDSGPHNAEILIAVLGSGIAILLGLFSLALEQAVLPALLAFFVLLVVENSLFPMMPIWTLMLGRWGLGLVYGCGLTAAFVLVMIRITKKLTHRTE
jgi:hypothetical protein